MNHIFEQRLFVRLLVVKHCIFVFLLPIWWQRTLLTMQWTYVLLVGLVISGVSAELLTTLKNLVNTAWFHQLPEQNQVCAVHSLCPSVSVSSCLSTSLSLSLSPCLSFCPCLSLFVYLSVCLSLWLSACLSVSPGVFARFFFFFFLA